MNSIGFSHKFDKNVSSIIALFLTPKQYKFLDWIDQNKLNWIYLSSWVDESILKKNANYIQWLYICMNENASSLIQLLLQNNKCKQLFLKELLHFQQHFDTYFGYHDANDVVMSEYVWDELSHNSSQFAINLLENNPQKINWNYLSYNSHPRAISWLEQNPHKINWDNLCSNPNAIHILNEKTKNFTINLHFIDWYNLSSNPNAISILEKNRYHIKWESLSKNPKAFHLTNFQENIQIHWTSFCQNPAAIHLLQNNQHTIDWNEFSYNSAIIEFDHTSYNILKTAWSKIVYNL